jgi:Tol biopolymer transport system component
MPIEVGSRLGPYEILAPLGAGGMGEVYKARDTQLGREVAIKTLPASCVSSEERKRRFLQEARAASGLNHPGIVTIHDINRSAEVVGTVAYMSPEQAEGKKIDARSDIFSFGAVLYEMTTGRRAFTGDSSASTMAAVLKSEPKPPSQLVEGLPRDLERIVLRCLRKDPARRFQHVSDLKVDLEELKETTVSGKSASPDARTARPRRLPWIAAAFATALLLAAALLLRRSGPATPSLVPVPLTTYEGTESYPTFSPDASQVAFTWNGEQQDTTDVYVKVVGTGPPLRLTKDSAVESFPAWSPDGRQIAFLRARQGIFLIPPIGGTERLLFDGRAGPSQLSWSPDGKDLAFAMWPSPTEPGGIFLISAQGGEPRRFTRAESGRVHRAPALSPDGRSLAYADCPSPQLTDLCQLLIVALTDSRPQTAVLPKPLALAAIAWSSDGDSLILGQLGGQTSTTRLWQVSVRSDAEPRLLSFAVPGSRDVTLSRSGSRMAYSVHYGNTDLWVVENGSVTRSPIHSTVAESQPQFSPDGRKIAFGSQRGGSGQVWIADIDGSNAVQLTSSEFAGSPRWSPDSRAIVYDTLDPGGTWDIEVINLSSRQLRRLVPHPANDVTPSFSRDGKWVYFASLRRGRYEVYRLPASGGDPIQLTDSGGVVPYESVDGRSIYYMKSFIGCSPLYVRPLSGGPERQVVDMVCSRAFQVTDHGIYYIGDSRKDRMPIVQVYDPATGKSTVVGRAQGRLYLSNGLAVSPDGKTVLFAASAQSGADLMLVEGFR